MYSTPYEGATGEVGDPSFEINPSAPEHSRLSGDPFVHCMSEIDAGLEVIRFWFPEAYDTKVVPLNYEILHSKIKGIGQSKIACD